MSNKEAFVRNFNVELDAIYKTQYITGLMSFGCFAAFCTAALITGDIPQPYSSLCITEGAVLAGITTASCVLSGFQVVANKEKSIYEIIIDKVRKMAHDLKLETPNELYVLFVYLYAHGYLSYNKDFATDRFKGRDEIEPIGTAIFAGRGRCRHIASLFTDIVNSKEDFGCKAINLQVYSTDDKNDWVLDMEGFRHIGNHLITLIEYKNELYAFDPSNIIILTNYEPERMIYSGRGEYLKISDSIVWAEEKDIKELIDRYQFHTYSDSEESSAIRALEICIANEEKFEKFNKENEVLFKIVYDMYVETDKQRAREK